MPATPQGFTVQPIADEPGIFEITDVNITQLAVEHGLSAFLWRVETTQDTLYMLQVAHESVFILSGMGFFPVLIVCTYSYTSNYHY